MKKKISIIAISLLSLSLLSACAKTDVIGRKSIDSFQAVLNAIPENVIADEINDSWSLTSPDGGERFIWSKNAKLPYDILLEIDIKPFLEAGLDTSKLPAKMISDENLIIGTSFGEEELKYKEGATPIASYEKLVELKRERIHYHAESDHFNVEIVDGNMFEWAKDMDTNDKDIVFVLNPAILIDAGVDPEKVDGWLFTKVKTMSHGGKSTEVDKLLKTFDIQ